MKANVGMLDRVVRIAAGLGLIPTVIINDSFDRFSLAFG